MKPNPDLITIDNNEDRIKELLLEMVLLPRKNAIKWSKLTKQTPNIKIGYPGQHLASLITGVEGERTGARGNDLADGSEVKSCSRIDQLDSCKVCGASVARIESKCPNCDSDKIRRNNDSKWLFTIRSEDDLRLLTKEIQRVLLIIADYPNFDSGDYDTIRFQSFEIWPQSSRNARFSELMSNYYNNIYLEHKKVNPRKTPAPKNFWPYTYQFYISNPILTFSAIVTDANNAPEIHIDRYVKPEQDRNDIESVLMPTNILTESELEQIRGSVATNESLLKDMASDDGYLSGGISEESRQYLVLRDTDKISTAKKKYKRNN